MQDHYLSFSSHLTALVRCVETAGQGQTLRGHRYKFDNGRWIFEQLDDKDHDTTEPQSKQPSGTFDIREARSMKIIEHVYPGHERVVEFSSDGFQCYIAVHSTKLGPAIGGCRVKPYSDQAAALLDVLRLSKSMTYKCSMAGLHFGGGKCVVAADKPTPDLMHMVGDAVNHFNGQYITAEDVGTTLDDLKLVADVTNYCVHQDGAFMTAVGVYSAMQAAYALQNDWWMPFNEAPIFVEGLGKVGSHLVKLLVDNHASQICVSDIRPDLVSRAVKEKTVFKIAENDKKFMAIYAPCAIGQVINPGNLHSTRYSVICGSANNQLTDDSMPKDCRRTGCCIVPTGSPTRAA